MVFAFPSRSRAMLIAGVVALGLLTAACADDGAGIEDGNGLDPAATSDAMTPTEAPPTEAPTEAPTESETGTPADTTEQTPAPAGDASGVTVEVSEEGELAPFLVDGEGMTLYLFTNDEPGVSNCDADCQGNWPPLMGEEPMAGEGVTGTLDVLDSGQVTYDEQPLYYFAGDEAAGDTNGEGVGDVWFVIEP